MKSLFLISSIIIGIFIPQAHQLSFLIQYLLMYMLFISFLQIKITHKIFTRSTLLILGINIALAFLVYYILLPFNQILALIGFVTAITPTAISAPVVTQFLHGKAEYVAASVLLTNIAIALTLPLFIFILTSNGSIMPVMKTLVDVLILMFVPLVTAQIILLRFQSAAKFLTKFKNTTYYALVLVVFFAIAKASNFISLQKDIPLAYFILIASIPLVICIINFSLGRIVGGRKFAVEASQSLGQKNTMFSIWYALSFLNPLIALGPIFYIIYHNIYNSFQMLMIEKKFKIL